MFKMLELVFAVLIVSTTLAICTQTLPASVPNGVRRAVSLLARKSTFPMMQAYRPLDMFVQRSN